MVWTELEYHTLPQQHSGHVDERGGETGVKEEEEDEAEEPHGEYSYVCKCGYRYIVSESELDRLLDEEDGDVNELRLSCESCSLGLRITADEQ